MTNKRSFLARYYGVLTGLLAVSALVAWLLSVFAQTETQNQQSAEEDAILAKLQEDPTEDPKDVTGRYCLELSPVAESAARTRLVRSQMQQIAVILATKTRADALRLASTIQPQIEERAVNAHSLLLTHFARLAFAEGDLDVAEADARAALDLDDGSACFAADAHYVLGRIASKRGEEDAALLAQVAAVERFADHIPALLEISRLGFLAHEQGPRTEAAAQALLLLSNISGARIYAQSLLRDVNRLGCATAQCDYLRAVLENWLGLPGAALDSLSTLETRCQNASCPPSLLASAASFRPRLAERLSDKRIIP